MSATTTSAASSPAERPRLRDFLALEHNVAVLAGATFLLTFGESLWFHFTPRYLQALGAGVLVVGAWGSLRDLLDAAWQYPGGALADRAGRKGALLALTGMGLLGLALVLVPWWPVALLGLALYMALMAYAQPVTFAVIGDALPRARRAMGFVVQSVLRRVPLLVGAPVGGWLITERLGVVEGVRVSVGLAIALALLALWAQARHFRAPAELAARPGAFRARDLPPALRRLLLSDILVRMGESATRVFLILYVVLVLGYTDLGFGLLLALQTLVSIAVYLPAGRAADRGSRRPWVALTFLFFALHPLAVLGAVNPVLLALAFVLGGLREIGEPARKASIVDLAPAEHRGRAVGAYYALRGFAIMPVAFLAGLLWTLDPAFPFLVGAALSGLGLVVYALTVRGE